MRANLNDVLVSTCNLMPCLIVNVGLFFIVFMGFFTLLAQYGC